MSTLLSLLLFLSLAPQPNDEKETNYSVYFDGKSEPATKKLIGIDPKYYGNYSLLPRSENDMRTAAGDQLTLDASGMYVEKNKILSISRTEVRENSKYTVREGYLHGVLPGDSVVVALEDETYYFLLPKKTYLYEVGMREALLYEGLTNGEFLILSKEDNSYYSAVYVSITGGKVALKELNFDQEVFDFRTVSHKKITTDNMPTYILQPSASEWQQVMQYFATYDTYALTPKTD